MVFRTLVVGLGVRGRPAGGLWLGTTAISYVGASAAADGPSIVYRSRQRAYAIAFDASGRFTLRSFFLEPGAEVGAAWIHGATSVTPAQLRDDYVAGNFGPVLRLGLRRRQLAFAIEGAALYVPTTVAAPIIRGSAIVGLTF